MKEKLPFYYEENLSDRLLSIKRRFKIIVNYSHN